MVQPPDYVSQNHPEFVCKLKKALYGLKKLQELGTVRLLNSFCFVVMLLLIPMRVCLLRSMVNYI